MDLRRWAALAALLALFGACNGDPAPEARRSDATRPPPTIAAVTTDGRVVVLASETGEELRALAVEAETDAFAGVAMSADGRFVYFVRPRGLETREIIRIPERGGDLRTVGIGHSPSPHPDGTRIAHVGTEPEFGDSDRVVIRPIDREEVSQWLLEPREGVDVTAYIHSVSWAPDGQRVAYLVAYEASGELFLLDPPAVESLWDGELLRPEGTEGSWQSVAFRGEMDQVGVVSACCYPAFEQWWRLLSVEARAGGAVETLLELDGPATMIDFDPSGHHVLFVRDQTLYRWSGEGEPLVVAEGILAASW